MKPVTSLSSQSSQKPRRSIAIDYTAAHEQGGGIGRYVRELVRALARQDETNDYRLFVAGAEQSDLPPAPAPNFHWKPTRLSPLMLARVWHRARIPVPVELFTGRVGLYHATDFVLPPTLPATRTLLTVHDLSFVRVPEAASPRLKAYLDAVVPRSVRRADHVLADSQATKDDLIALYGTPEDKITVLLSGVNERFRRVDTATAQRVRQKYGLGERPFVLSIGTVQPRKNYPRLVRALRSVRDAGYDVDLVIAGGKGWLQDPLYDAIRDSGMKDRVHLIGFADDDDLPALYSAAQCLAFPSLYEGFGLPVLEAMACGTPVVTSSVSSLPEVAGDAALMVEPTDVEALADALGRLLTDQDLRDELARRGYAQARKFTWDRAAEALEIIYDRLFTMQI